MKVCDLDSLSQKDSKNKALNTNFATQTIKSYQEVWRNFIKWLNKDKEYEITYEDMDSYIKHTNDTIPNDFSYYHAVLKISRAINSLKRYVQYGYFRKNFSTRYKRFDDDNGVTICKFLEEYKKTHSENSVIQKRYYLFLFHKFLNHKNLSINCINNSILEEFITKNIDKNSGVLALKTTISVFMKWCIDNKYVNDECLLFLPKLRVKRYRDIDKTFSTNECKEILGVIDKNSDLGRRDYAILLCIILYGLRNGDVCKLEFNNIDWQKNIISFCQEKTNECLELPLLPVVGNAIIDYVKNSRPNSDSKFIFLQHWGKFIGKQITTHIVYDRLQIYIRRAGIKNLANRKHGTHALRFSLATSLIKEGVSLDLTQEIIGHRNRNTTYRYLKLDINSLSQCCIESPQCISQFYMER